MCAAFVLLGVREMKSRDFKTEHEVMARKLDEYKTIIKGKCSHLLSCVKMKLKEIVRNLCSTLTGEHKHCVPCDGHGKIATCRWTLANLTNLKYIDTCISHQYAQSCGERGLAKKLWETKRTLSTRHGKGAFSVH